jgi:eukaryotic-like serine/threonine-protein kinase
MLRWGRKSSSPSAEPATIGRYRVTGRLGEGGMGVVYAAHDDRLDRPVAVKRIREVASDPGLKERLLREARAAASINHPNVCHVYELAEEGDELYLVMERLTGEPLSDRIAREPVPLAEALQISLGILGALEALHGRGVVHRDLKPSNVFLTPHGVKLLDFGLARPLVEQLKSDNITLTQPGTIVGTPRYMPPEQWEGEPYVPASDLFAVGAILFEMLAGKAAFPGSTIIEVYRAVAMAQPPALTGGAEVVAADRIIQLALAKRPADRYPDAAAMAQEIRSAWALIDTGSSPRARAVTRLIVLPFRVLRADPETDFLAYSVPDAITASLSGLDALVVRSTAAGQRFDVENPDLKTIATEAGVDVVLLGTLLRAGDQVRLTTQMLEAPSGTLVSSHTAQVRLADIFQLQDDLARQIVDSLAIPLSARDHRLLEKDVPANARAYDLYLRGNHVGASSNPARLASARDFYRRCLEEDPGFAPGWARLGRVYRVLAKYGSKNQPELIRLAEQAFHRALEINPELPIAHNLYTYFEIEERGRALEAVVRLLEQVKNGAADPNLFAGLVVACRFCGLLEASLAADRRARRIDPAIQTSVQYTYWALADYAQAALHDVEDIQVMRHSAQWMLGREAEAVAGVRGALAHLAGSLEVLIVDSQLAAMEGRREDCVRLGEAVQASGFHDPEGLMLHVRELAYIGETARALELLSRVIQGGYHCQTFLTRDPWLDSLRSTPEFVRLVRQAEAGHARAAEAFLRAGGDRILGVGTG